MDIVAAAILWILAAARLRSGLDPRRGSVFRAALFAATACTLYVPAVYLAVDPLLGGRNWTKALTLVALLVGFWQFRSAVLIAVQPDEGRRRQQLAVGRGAVLATTAIAVAGFAVSDPGPTDRNLQLAYASQSGMALFLWTGSAFLIWVTVDAARICLRNLANLHSPIYRAGFLLIGFGCVAAGLTIVDRILYAVLSPRRIPGSPSAVALDSLYWIGETLAVVLIGVGLLIPRLERPMQRVLVDLKQRVLLAQLRPLWLQTTTGRNVLILETSLMNVVAPLKGHSGQRLHRRVIEIRDGEMASGGTLTLSTTDQALLERAEKALSRGR
ncbi:MAB_1171c family putative transporter [Arthrobacter sp. 35W]|uniref:MAB_1171c family putative transporter n=1 Tax=Arthrobacter sp. 35W TaxID=1132441 RepID=UPI000403B5FD|nr:MAB_1171c family putative transporter [Arthrobacter sp. 35W]